MKKATKTNGTARKIAVELFGQGKNQADVILQLQKQGMPVKASTVKTYFYGWKKQNAKANTQLASPAPREVTVARIATRKAELSKVDVINWVYTNKAIAASKKRVIADLLIN